MLAAHCTRRACSRARLSGGSRTSTSSATSSATPPTDAATTTHPRIFRGGAAADSGAPRTGGAGAGADSAAGAHGLAAGIGTGVRLSALNGLAQLLHDSVRPRYSSFCIAVIGYGWPQFGHGT